MLQTVEEVSARIRAGEDLLISGPEAMLRQLPLGRWIGGTTCYFMAEEGCVERRDRILAQPLPPEALSAHMRPYEPLELRRMMADSPTDGYTVVIFPAYGQAHLHYAEYAPVYPHLQRKKVVGWVAGTALGDKRESQPLVFFGPTGHACSRCCVAMHVALQPGYEARVRTLDPFDPDVERPFTFLEGGFTARRCLCDGQEMPVARLLSAHQVNGELPLIAEVAGVRTNVSIRRVDAGDGSVTFYAPVFPGVPYRFSRPLGDYAERIRKKMPILKQPPAFACACILNYVYGRLEGQRLGTIVGPITFGEVARCILNQTIVWLEIAEGEPAPVSNGAIEGEEN